MFQVVKKEDQYREAVPFCVYDVHPDKSGCPQFLIYADNEWKYVSAKHFVPAE